jgi:hypothetical protein
MLCATNSEAKISLCTFGSKVVVENGIDVTVAAAMKALYRDTSATSRFIVGSETAESRMRSIHLDVISYVSIKGRKEFCTATVANSLCNLRTQKPQIFSPGDIGMNPDQRSAICALNLRYV